MELLIPEKGLLFWMLISFGIVFFILAKYGFPVIIKMLAERKAFIDDSMASARKANEQLACIKSEGEEILKQAREERMILLTAANQAQSEIIAQAHESAASEARMLLEKAREEIEKSKELAMREIRGDIAGIALQISEKVIREKLQNKEEQTQIINRMLDDVSLYKS